MLVVLFLAVAVTTPAVTNAKTIKKITNGGYYSEYTTAKISDGKFVLKGEVVNWERSPQTPEYSKSGTFKFKLAKNCEILDGYKKTEKNISVKKFNKLCKKHDADHSGIAFTVKGNKVTMIRFW